MIEFRHIALSVALAAAIGLPAAASAAGASSVIPHGVQTFQPPTVGVLHAVKGVYTNWASNFSRSVAAGALVAADAPTTIKCTFAKGCTLLAGNFVQFYDSSTPSMAAICTEVDGNYMNNCGNYVGNTIPATAYSDINDRENLHVATGDHIVQTFVYLSEGGYLTAYQFDYTLTTP